MQVIPRPRQLFIAPLAAFACLVTVVVSLVVPTDAIARSSKPTVLILRVEGSSVADSKRRALTKALLRKARKYRHYRVVVSKSDLVEEMFEFECTEAGVECLSKIGKKYKAQFVIYSEVAKGAEGTFAWSMRVAEMKSERSQISRIAQSTVQKLESLDKPKKGAANGLLVLIGPISLPQKREVTAGTLHVRLIGGGVALVYVNEKLAGRSSLSGLKVQLQTGKYNVKVVRAGYKDWVQVVSVQAGKTLDRIVELQALPQQKIPVGGAKPVAVPITKKWWFWAGIVGVGAATAVTVWAVTRDAGAQELGNAAFSLDSNDAHLDPVFGGG